MVTLLTESIRRPARAQVSFFAGGALLVLFVLAFGARLIGITLFITPDEDNWMRRAGNFTQGLQTGDLTRTFQSGHPGVTTMWIASLGIGVEAERLAGITTPGNPVTRTPGFMDMLVRARLAMIFVNVVLLVGIVGLAARLLGMGPALVGGVILALDPFLVAHAQVVHVDSLSAGFMTVAMLSAGVYWWAGGKVGYLVLCGVASGLAVLTKAPSLVLGVLVPVVALAAPFLDRSSWPVTRVLRTLVLAGILGVAVVFAPWPSLWAAPVETISRFIRFTLETSSEHRPGNFFMGQAVADPGIGYYPIAIMFRLSPLALAGLLALGVLLPSRERVRPTVLLLVCVVGFILFLSLAGKKLDRYTLPVFPSLDLLAGLGLWTLGLWLAPYLSRAGLPERTRRLIMGGALLALTVAQAIPLAMVAPYALAYYNPMSGGGPSAARVILVGWGEGLDQVADFLNAQPNPEQQVIGVYFPLELNFQGMVAGRVVRFGDPLPVTHVVDYVNAAQRSQTPPEVVGMVPVKDVWINGIQYARVYRFEPPRRIQ